MYLILELFNSSKPSNDHCFIWRFFTHRIIYQIFWLNNSQIIVFSILLISYFIFSIFLSYNLIFIKNRNLDFFNEDLHLVILFFVFINYISLFFLIFDNNFSELFLSLTSSVSNMQGFHLSEILLTNLSFVSF